METNEVLVLRNCINCKELFIPKKYESISWTYILYCDDCRKIKLNNFRKLKECNLCKKEVNVGKYRIINNEVCCIKCIKKKRNKDRLLYEKENREKKVEKKIDKWRDYYNKVCVDCGEKIKIIHFKPYRCESCQKISIIEQRRENAKKQSKLYKGNYKTCYSQLGTISMVKKTHMIKDTDGNPDWNKEIEDIKKLKQKTYNSKRNFISKENIQDDNKSNIYDATT